MDCSWSINPIYLASFNKKFWMLAKLILCWHSGQWEIVTVMSKFARLTLCMCVCWQGAAWSVLRQQREAAALSTGDHRMADSQGWRAVGAAAHRRRRGGRSAPEGVPPGKVDNYTFSVQMLHIQYKYWRDRVFFPAQWGINFHRMSTHLRPVYIHKLVYRYCTYRHQNTYTDVFTGVFCLLVCVAEGISPIVPRPKALYIIIGVSATMGEEQDRALGVCR